MRQVTAASIVALGSFIVPASAQQTIIYNDPAFQPQGQVFQPQQPFGTQQPLYIDPNTGQPLPQQPNFGQPLPQAQPQAGFGQQPFQQQQQPGFGQPLPQPQQQQPFGQPLPQPQQTYNPPQPTTTFQPQATDIPQNNVPYYDRTVTTPAPQPETGFAPIGQPSSIGEQVFSPAQGDPALSASAPFPSMAGGTDRAPEMSAELSELLRVGERYRAASPGFLEDLKALAAKYRDPLPAAPSVGQLSMAGPQPIDSGSPDLAGTDPSLAIDPLTAPNQIEGGVTDLAALGAGDGAVTVVEPLDPGSVTFAFLEDDFTDGEIDSNPPWRARQGDWFVDPKYGLRARAPEQATNDPIRPKELLKVLLTGETPDTDESAGPKAALIESQTSIGNAFSFAARVVDHAGTGTAHFIMHQGGANWLGYRLELRSGPQPVVVLTRRGSNGYKDITKVAAPGFTKGETHELRWARLSDGQMLVILNGRPIITSRDTVFREDWKGFAFFNAGGDVSIRAIRIAAPVER